MLPTILKSIVAAIIFALLMALWYFSGKPFDDAEFVVHLMYSLAFAWSAFVIPDLMKGIES